VASDVSAELRHKVARRAGFRCEYCGIHEDDAGFSHQIDHVVSRKHGGRSTLENLAYSCLLCNRFKGSDVAAIDSESREAVKLFNPRKEQWGDHFSFDYDFSVLKALTATGRATIRLLHLNAPERIEERKAIVR
jgi:hypothetical protein